MGNENDNRTIRSRSEKRKIENGHGEGNKKEFYRGNRSQNNIEPDIKDNY